MVREKNTFDWLTSLRNRLSTVAAVVYSVRKFSNKVAYRFKNVDLSHCIWRDPHIGVGGNYLFLDSYRLHGHVFDDTLCDSEKR